MLPLPISNLPQNILKSKKTPLISFIPPHLEHRGVMTTSPEKLAPVAEHTPLQYEARSIESIDDLIATFASDPIFQLYTFAIAANGVANLERDGISQRYLSPDVWNSLTERVRYIEQATDPKYSIICVGTPKELEALPEDLKRPDILQLCLPVGNWTLLHIANGVHNLKSLIATSDAQSQKVQEANQAVKYVMSISRELNGERDTSKLLSLILTKAREICHADAGSIYTVDSPTRNIRDGVIQFRFTQNHSIVQNLSEFSMPVNEGSIVGNACIHAASINIPDLYLLNEDPKKNPYGARHDRTWDKRIGYESHSMLTVPMFDISHSVIGVIQLINRKKDKTAKLLTPDLFSEQVVPFDERDQELAEIVAQQAGIALENANMHQNIQELFDGFVNASVTAIEQRDKTTSGHSHRVAFLCVGLAEVINRCDVGIYKDANFSEDQIQEIRYASLLHDFGKLGVRENVLTKEKKLYPWEMERVQTRFELIRAQYEIEYLKKCIEYLQAPDHFPNGANPYTFEFEKNIKVKELDEFLKFIVKANEPTVLEQGGFEKLKDIANLQYRNFKQEKHPFLVREELSALSVSRGSLTREEFTEIQSHVTHTYDFLRKIPWGKKLANVPEIAAKHHEKLDGSGYPHAAPAEAIPTQARMMTIADIFDALTAADRPYKKSVPVNRALEIIEMEVKGGKVDGDLFKLFCDSKVYEAVLDPSFTLKI